MWEAAITVLILTVFALLAYASSLTSGDVMVLAGALIGGIGLLVSIPGGLVYHVRLRQALAAGGAVPRRWWLHPTDHHKALAPDLWRKVRPSFVAGAAGFGVFLLGALLIVWGAAKI
ncbi:MAG: hypothetical protein HY903_02495 [Deltaproteobacteria bacterium]|nr:hypothetical protein [Deltaproteobacteria bacterium]